MYKLDAFHKRLAAVVFGGNIYLLFINNRIVIQYSHSHPNIIITLLYFK